MEGYFFYRALITVFETDRLKTIHHYLIGYGGPVLVIIATVSVTLSGHEVPDQSETSILCPLTNQKPVFCLQVYLRRDAECRLVACFLTPDAMVAMFTPAVLVAVINGGVTGIAIWVAHKASGRRYNYIMNTNSFIGSDHTKII